MRENKCLIEKEELIVFARQLSLIINSQLSLHDGLQSISDKTNCNQLKLLISDVLEDIQNQATLREAFKKHKEKLGDFFINMIDIGEKSGSLVSVLDQIADSLEKEMETKNKIKSAMSYPLLLSLLMLGVVILLVVKILPMFNEVLESLGGTMPFLTFVILQISSFVSDNLLIIIITAIIGFALISLYKTTIKGRYFFDKLKFRLPIQKQIVSAYTATRFSRNLSILIKSGVDIIYAMELIKPVMNNLYVEEKLETAISSLKKGDELDKVIEDLELFPWVLIKLISIAQHTGHLDNTLEKAAVVMEVELDNNLKRLTTVIEPLLILLLSIIVGIILVSVVLPVISIMNSIG